MEGKWSEVKKNQRDMEEKDKRLCLYECLRAVGLQSYYSSLSSVGVRCAAHLSRLTMEDYPILGICSMEDRTRLFQLIQIVKTLEIDSEDDEYSSEETYTEGESGITCDGCGDPDGDAYDDEDETRAVSFSKASCVRKLDFSCDSIDEKLSTHSVDTVYQNNNHKTGVYSHQYDCHKGANTKPDVVRQSSTFNFPTRLSTKCVSPIVKKSKPKVVTSKRVISKDGKGISRKEKPVKEINSKEVNVHTATTSVYQAKRTADYNYGLPLSSPTTPKQRRPGGQRISVCVRKRPLTRAECRRGEVDVVTTYGECVIIHESKEAVDLTQYTLQHRFYFDHVFGEESSNEEVYQRTAYPLVQHMLNGGKATCFAYGQTGAGKTHTMLGSSPRRPGMYTLAAQDIFAHLSTVHTHSPMMVFVSFFEIYCGQLYDLLDHRKRLFAREDGQKVVHIAGLRVVSVDSVNSLLEVISQGTEERTQGKTGVNPRSSRSHALLQIQLRGTNQQVAGKMWFVDLAGSERASDAKEPGKQSRVEGAEINQSLLALKECIRSLDQEQLHTPFRQNKLTQILRDSFVGDSMTCMIANISPGDFTTEHTLNTLRYADRVKELRRQEGLRGGKKDKTIPSPMHNLFSSGGTGGKSPQKKAKPCNQKEAFSPSAPAVKLTTGDTILCSKAISSRWKEETRPKKMIGLEQITPIRHLLGTSDKRKKAGRRRERDKRRETHGGNGRAGHPTCDQNIDAPVAFRQSTEKMQRISALDHKEKVDQQSTSEDGKEGERCKLERLSVIDLQKVHEREKERDRHLKWYHQQLQRFMPSPMTSFDSPFLNPTSPPFSSSSKASFSSSVSLSSIQPSSFISLSTFMHHDLEKTLDEYRSRIEVQTDGKNGHLSSFPSEEINLQPKTSPGHNKNTFEVGCEVSGGISEDRRVHSEGTGAGFGQKGGKSEKMKSLRATGERDVRVKIEDWRIVGMEQQEERNWPFVAMAETEQTNNHPPAQSPHQRAPAERPLSPSFKQTDTFIATNKVSDPSSTLKNTRVTSKILPPILEILQQGVSSGSFKEKEFVGNASRRECENTHSNSQPLNASVTQTGCETLTKLSENTECTQVHDHAEAENKISALNQGEPCTDHLSSIIDPLGISLFEVNQPVPPVSFLQGEHSNSPLSLSELGKSMRGEKRVDNKHLKASGDEEAELHLSLLELSQTRTQCPSTSDTIVSKDCLCFHTDKRCGIDMMKPPTPEVKPFTIQNQESNHKPKTKQAIEVVNNKAPTSPHKSSASACVETCAMQSSSSSFQHTGLHSSQILMHNKLDVPISKPQSKSAPDQLNTKLCHTVHSNCSSNSSIPVQPGTVESNTGRSTSNLHIKPVIRLSMLEDFYQDQWHIVQAHWEQLEEMETLCHQVGTLLCQQPDMAFDEYVCKLGEIMERKACCVHRMIAQLQPYLKTSHSNQGHNQERNNHD
ncbi:kinesin-like protein KIF24 isoform X2 [Antennarius striatus]|uniref:kinesin-like protein KIF24 isoform X2 n=1 Tax=Antennarius striatus TaxID=241820 RepID=UPI0035B37002